VRRFGQLLASAPVTAVLRRAGHDRDQPVLCAVGELPAVQRGEQFGVAMVPPAAGKCGP
jgi:hypothetical protein